jgi:hypothetical protein
VAVVVEAVAVAAVVQRLVVALLPAAAEAAGLPSTTLRS